MLLRLAAMLIALPAIALAAGALAADAPDGGGGGHMTVIGAPAKTAAAETPDGAADASMAAPAVAPLPPPAPVDGSECRMGCAQAYYFCRVDDQSGACAPTWSQCVAACDLPNLDTGVSTAP